MTFSAVCAFSALTRNERPLCLAFFSIPFCRRFRLFFFSLWHISSSAKLKRHKIEIAMCYCCALLLSFHSFIFPASLLLMLTTVLYCCLSSTCRLNKMLIFPTRFFIFSFIRCCFFRVLFVAIHTPTQTVLLVSLDFTSRHLLMYKKRGKERENPKLFSS